MDLDAAAHDSLHDLKPIIMAALPSGLDALYQKIRGTPEIARFFTSTEMLQHAKDKQHEHWWSLTTKGPDEQYMTQAIKIGQGHARIGLEPSWYVASYALVLEHLVRAVLAAHWPKSLFHHPKTGMEQVGDELAVLIKSALLDMELALSAYFKTQVTSALLQQREKVAE